MGRAAGIVKPITIALFLFFIYPINEKFYTCNEASI